MNAFTRLTSLIVFFGGLALALYVGLWVCVIGGFIDIVNGAIDKSVAFIALGVIKIFVSDIAGVGIFAATTSLAGWLQEDNRAQKTS